MMISERTPAATTVSIRLSPLGRKLLTILLLLLCSEGVQAQQSQVFSLRLRVQPEEARVYLVTLDGVRNYLGTAEQELDVEVTQAMASSERTRFVFSVPQWFGGEYPNWGQVDERALDEVDLDDFSIVLGQNQLRKGQFPLDGSRIQLPLPATVALQAWTLANPWLAGGGLGGIVLLLLALSRSRAILTRLTAATAEPKRSLAGDYRLLNKIGEGGMGEVWAASTVDEVRCALKFIKADLADDPDFKKRLEREIKMCLPLDHPNLLKLYGYGVASDGRVYTVSELLEGQTLKELLASGEHDPPQLASRVLEEVGDALSYLHERTLVHRDVKPDNIFVCSDGTLKLMDMGLLRGVEARTKVTHTGQMLGTPAYMPPEQMGTTGFAPAADQYSMGIILYEILAGQRPFIQPDPVLIAYQHMHVAPQPPSQHQPRITPQIEAAVLKMIMKKPEERFASMKEAQAALESLRFTSWRDTTEDTRAASLKKAP